ncbi:MAG: hypothetical protein IJZ26_01380 [Clostridia bacterium]|nr:hypothetical protein [Clostridia bacterium]
MNTKESFNGQLEIIKIANLKLQKQVDTLFSINPNKKMQVGYQKHLQSFYEKAKTYGDKMVSLNNSFINILSDDYNVNDFIETTMYFITPMMDKVNDKNCHNAIEKAENKIYSCEYSETPEAEMARMGNSIKACDGVISCFKTYLKNHKINPDTQKTLEEFTNFIEYLKNPKNEINQKNLMENLYNKISNENKLYESAIIQESLTHNTFKQTALKQTQM